MVPCGLHGQGEPAHGTVRYSKPSAARFPKMRRWYRCRVAFKAGGSAFPVMGRYVRCRLAFLASGSGFPVKGERS